MFTLLSIPSKATAVKADHQHLSYTSGTASGLPGSLQSVSEKEESEVESDIDIEMMSFCLPFLASFNTQASSQIDAIAACCSTYRVSQPVYILISLFRI